MTEQKSWQSAINSQLSQRLIRPLIQPGIISFAGATEIIQRSQRFSSRHPLLNNPRWSSLKNLEGDKVPIVHAQMTVPKESEVQQTGVRKNETPVVQAKRIIESEQAFESQNKLDYSQSQPKYTLAKSTSQSSATNSSNLIIQRKIDPSASQSQSHVTSSPSTSNYHNGEKSSSLDWEISSTEIPKPPVSNVVIPTSPLLPDREIILPQQHSNPLHLANSNSHNLSNSNLLNQNININPLSSKSRDLSRQHNQQQFSEEENTQSLSPNHSYDGETSELINHLPVVKSNNIIVPQENNLTQLNKNNSEENPSPINSLLPVVKSRPKLYSEEANSTELSKHKQLNYSGQKEETKSGKVETIVKSSPREIRDEQLILKEVVQARKESNYPDITTIGKLPNLASDFSSKTTNQANTLPVVQPKLLIGSQSSSTEKLSSSQSQRKSVIVNPQQIKSPQIKTPLILSQGATGQQTQENNKKTIYQPNNYSSVTNKLSQPRNPETLVNQWLVNQNQQKYPDSQSQQKIDLNAITNQVELRLKRRLIAESERRGKKFR